MLCRRSHVSRPLGLCLAALAAACGPPERQEEAVAARTAALFAPELPAGWQSARVGSPDLFIGVDHDDVTATFRTETSGGNISGTTDRFVFTYRAFTGDGEIVGRVTGFQRDSTAARHGIMVRGSLTGNSAHVTMYQRRDKALRYNRRSGTGATATDASIRTGGTFEWFKIVRRGNVFTSFTSSNGLGWTQFRSETVSGIPSKAYYGVAVASHSPEPIMSFVDAVRVAKLPDPYQSMDIGSTGATGSATFTYGTNVFQVRGAGTGISARTDAVGFLYRGLRGDARMSAQFTAVEGGSNAKGGLMIRSSDLPHAAMAFLYRKPSGNIGFHYRSRTGLNSAHIAHPTTITSPTLQIERLAATRIIARVSSNGTSWTQVADVVIDELAELEGQGPRDLMVGFANTSGTSGTLSRATLSKVQFQPAHTQRANLRPTMANFEIERKLFLAEDPNPEDDEDHGVSEVAEGCIDEGEHLVLRFDFMSENHGRADVRIGEPSEREDLFVFQGGGHGHYHFNDYNKYVVTTLAGTPVVASKKQSFCLMDTNRVEPWAWQAVYECENQGISPGYADKYSKGVDCQFVVVDGLTDGEYFVEATTNATRFVIEDDYSDNTSKVKIRIDGISVPRPQGEVLVAPLCGDLKIDCCPTRTCMSGLTCVGGGVGICDDLSPPE